MRDKDATADVFDTSHTIFSENHKISPRQIRRALSLELFGLSSLFLPSRLAGESGILGIAALAVGAAGAMALLCLWDKLSEHCDFSGGCLTESPAAKNRDTESGKKEIRKRDRKRSANCREGNAAEVTLPQKIFLVLAGIGLLELAAGVLYLLTALMRDQLLNSRYEPAILITLTAAGVFGLRKGLESRIRIYEVLFWILLIPLTIILVIACISVRPVYWLNTAYTMEGFWKSCGISFLFFSLSSLLLFFKPHCNPPQKAAKSARCSIFITLALNAAVYLILLGIFQDWLLAELEFPVILLMAVVKLPGGFFERQDAFMVGIWFFCLFALFHSALFYGNEMMRSVLPRGRERNSGKTLALSCICGAIVFAAACFMLQNENLAKNLESVMLCVTGLMLLILPFCYYLCRRRS
ncbi:MAG: GerAB/ArcD/ProY family transporter [Clostridiales bacterium]|nr:GerAB/ArcD/ProY family transporter [Clostridiales bacterium]